LEGMLAAPSAPHRPEAPARDAADPSLARRVGEAPPEFSLSGPWLTERPPGHPFLYTLRVELHAHRQRSGRSALGFLADLQQHACVLDARVVVADQDLTAGLPAGPVTYECLCSSALPPDELASRLQVLPDEIGAVAG